MPGERSLRFRILQRDDFTCCYCGRKAPDVILQVDHIQPASQGGKTAWNNLVTACFDCNQGKKDSLLSPEHVERFTPSIAIPVPQKVKAVKPPVQKRQPVHYKKTEPKVRIAIVNGGQYTGKYQTLEAIPVSRSWVYVGPDLFLDTFRCENCDFVNTYEGDNCSCRRQRAEVASHSREEPFYCDCGEELEPDDDELCRHCHDSLYVYCWTCGENEQPDDSRYCATCTAKDSEIVGGVL